MENDSSFLKLLCFITIRYICFSNDIIISWGGELSFTPVYFCIQLTHLNKGHFKNLSLLHDGLQSIDFQGWFNWSICKGPFLPTRVSSCNSTYIILLRLSLGLIKWFLPGEMYHSLLELMLSTAMHQSLCQPQVVWIERHQLCSHETQGKLEITRVA